MHVAGFEIPVLFSGESGTGKKVVARMIHKQPHRAKQTFIPENCTALPQCSNALSLSRVRASLALNGY
ncbi:MAG TPA: sigma 54-interacting transcriptional regulator [Terriglobia bacterium]|nr:sigma 54-interacting transcriptional regulator [Terriglobia bacterium]